MTKYQLINEIIINKLGYDKNIKNNIMNFLLPSKIDVMAIKEHLLYEYTEFIHNFNQGVENYVNELVEHNDDEICDDWIDYYHKCCSEKKVCSLTNSIWSFIDVEYGKTPLFYNENDIHHYENNKNIWYNKIYSIYVLKWTHTNNYNPNHIWCQEEVDYEKNKIQNMIENCNGHFFNDMLRNLLEN
jgi:hypothetical protein